MQMVLPVEVPPEIRMFIRSSTHSRIALNDLPGLGSFIASPALSRRLASRSTRTNEERGSIS